MHTGWKSRGGGFGMFLPKFLGGGLGFQEKLPGGVHLFCYFIAFLLTSFSKICLGGVLFHTPPSPPPYPPLCASMLGNFGDTQMCRDTQFEKHCVRQTNRILVFRWFWLFRFKFRFLSITSLDTVEAKTEVWKFAWESQLLDHIGQNLESL